MDPAFWHQRWQQNRIGFHQEKINSRLKKYWPQLDLAKGSRVFVPLCGKSLDMMWLLQSGYHVLGVELSAQACADFFSENELPFDETEVDHFRRFTFEGIELLAGDFFDLDAGDLKSVAAVYDRAALVALPPDMRPDYVAHLAALLPVGTPLLLISMSYDESRMQGPPFSVQDDEVQRLFAGAFDVECVGHSSGPDIVGNLGERGLETLEERVYRITRADTRARC